MRRRNLFRKGTAYTVFLLGCIAWLFCHTPSFACSCGPQPSVAQAFERADVVFSGIVIGIRHDFEAPVNDTPLRTYYTFQVDRLWKGLEKMDESGKLTITTEWNLCSTTYYIGQPILDYAYYGIADHLYNYGVCGRRGLQDAVELGTPVAEWDSISPSPAEKILGEWSLADPIVHSPIFRFWFMEEGIWGSCGVKSATCEEYEGGWFGIDGNRLTLRVTDSPDPERIGISLVTEATFPGNGMVVLTRAIDLTRGIATEERITFSMFATAAEEITWGSIKIREISRRMGW